MKQLVIPGLRAEYSNVDLVVEQCFGSTGENDSFLGVEPHEALGSVTVKNADGPRGLPQPFGFRGAQRELWTTLRELWLRGERFRATGG